MDPKACVDQAAEMFADGDIDGATERLDAFDRWGRQGGFQTDSDVRTAKKLRRNIRVVSRSNA